MCGRFVLISDAQTIQTAFDLSSTPHDTVARFNIAPTQPVAVITNENPHELTYHRWGLIPSWSKDMKIGSTLINARSETIEEKPSFRTAFKRRRCLIPADGFFEWKKQVDDSKTPMFIHLKDNPLFAFAGLWEVWNSPEGDEIRTCTILTTDANPFMASIHHRMPVILPRSDYEAWLSDEQSAGFLKAMLKPYDPDQMTAYEVSRLVNKPSNDTPECIEPVA
jgi:putative SOS response-associated peptidase YedK